MKVMVTMARLTRYVMLMGTVLGLNAVAPAPVQAGVIPWMYDAVFGPVGSIRANRATYRSGYGGGYGMAYSAYAPTTVAYAPVSMASYGGYGGGGCSTCNQTANYAPAYSYDSYYGGPSYANYGVAPAYGTSGCSTCNSCGNSGYVGGSTCSNCNVGSSPSSANYGTVPSPSPIAPIPESYNSTDRIHRLENKVIDLQREMDRHFKRTPNNESSGVADPYGPQGRGAGETVRGRNENTGIHSTFESEPDDKFSSPRTRTRAPGTAPIEENTERDTQKINLAPPVKLPDEKPPEEKPAEDKVQEAVPQVLRLDSRVTTRAIAPRERVRVGAKPAATKVSQATKKTTTSWLDSSLTSDVSRH